MDLIITSCRNDPFVDDKFYDRMCFGCFHTPKGEIVTYTPAGEVEETTPVWDHKHLYTAQELVDQGSCESLAEARKCVRSVKAAIKAAGLDGRKKSKPKKQPKQTTILNDAPIPKKTRRKS